MSSINEKYNGYQTISIEDVRKERKNFKPIDIIYKPTKNPEKSSLCYFASDTSKAYHNFIALAIKLNSNTAYINVIIAINFSKGRKDRKDTQKVAREFLG